MDTRCARCLMPALPLGPSPVGPGLCGTCKDQATIPSPPAESTLLNLVKKHRGKHGYDCAVLCSGGLDSTAALHMMKRHYGVEPLALTLDHGLLSAGALANVRRAAEALGVDHIAFAHDLPRRVASGMLAAGGRALVCQACAPWLLETALDLAARFDAPFLVTGWTRPGPTEPGARAVCGCDPSRPEYAPAAADTDRFLAAELDGLTGAKGSPRSLEQARKRIPRRLRRPILSPHWFQPPPAEGWQALLTRELGWQPPAEATPWKSTPCALAATSVHGAVGDLGISTALVQLSERVRAGQLDRAEAQALLEAQPTPSAAQIAAHLDPWTEAAE